MHMRMKNAKSHRS